MFDFLTDLDEYFCEKYANYDKLCILPGYKTPLMQTSTVDEFGRTRAYTLPADTMRLALQEKKAELLAELKARLTDLTFSFSFRPIGWFAQMKNKTSVYGFHRNFKMMLLKYGLSTDELYEKLAIEEEVWTGICKGKYLPTKNLIFSIGLVGQMSLEDTTALLALCDEGLDYAIPKDVVMSYLLHNRVYNEEMIEAALAEYKVGNLFIK